MLGISSSGRLLSSGPFGYHHPIDYMVKSFFDCAGITNEIQKQAINHLLYNLLDAGLLGKIVALYPMIGGTAVSHSYNLVDTKNYNLTFYGGWTHSDTGAKPNGINGYADTGLKSLSPSLTYNGRNENRHLSYYANTTSNNAELLIGVYNGGNGYEIIFPNNGGASHMANGSYQNSTIPLSNKGFFCTSMLINDTSFGVSLVGNKIYEMTGLIPFGPVDLTYYIGAWNLSNTPTFYASASCAFSSIGIGLSVDEILKLNEIVNQFQVTLNRAI